MLASRTVPAAIPFRVAVRPADLTLHLLGEGGPALASLALHGATLEDAGVSLGAAARMLGADLERFTLARPYQIPAHPLIEGAPFDAARAEDFAELADWFADADALLRELADGTPGASAVRCWPHHFDIAVRLAPGVGVGMMPGDDVYPEPYFYVSLDPAPRAEGPTLPALAGRGRWHLEGWVGAVLRGSSLTPDPSAQRDQVTDFIRSALAVIRDS